VCQKQRPSLRWPIHCRGPVRQLRQTSSGSLESLKLQPSRGVAATRWARDRARVQRAKRARNTNCAAGGGGFGGGPGGGGGGGLEGGGGRSFLQGGGAGGGGHGVVFLNFFFYAEPVGERSCCAARADFDTVSSRRGAGAAAGDQPGKQPAMPDSGNVYMAGRRDIDGGGRHGARMG